MSEKKIRVLIAKPGLDGHDRGAKVVARALRDAGFEVIYTGLRQTPEQIVEAAVSEDVDAVGLSLLSGAHNYLFPRVIELLKEQEADGILVFGGGVIPEDDIPELKKAGVSEVFTPGTPTAETVKFLQDHCGARDMARSVLTQLWPHTGRARIFGITGPPGAGKSTLTNALTKCWRAKGLRVGIIAVDPTSPFTGGAILGDRVRMGDLTLDTGVFIRSMGTRGQLGGLSPATAGAVHALDACGYDLILLETVGVGQSEVAVMEIADLVLVLNVPGLGDDVQAIKAGILEIGDLFAVNKADRPGADRTANELRAMLELGEEEKRPLPVLLVSASQGTGVTELCEELERQYLLLDGNGELARRRALRLRSELLTLVREGIEQRLLRPLLDSPMFAQSLERFQSRTESPYRWAEKFVTQISGGGPGYELHKS